MEGTDSHKYKVELGRSNRAFNAWGDVPIGNHVIAMSYQQLGRLRKKVKEEDVSGMFFRIICDEGHYIRRCQETKTGRMLMAFNAEIRWLFTGTPFVDGLHDFRGYVAFLKRAEWSERDRNDTYGADGTVDQTTRHAKAKTWYRRCHEDSVPPVTVFDGDRDFNHNDGENWKP